MKIDVDQLSNFIRQINGSNRMGVGAMAEKIAEYLEAQHAANAPEPVGVIDCGDEGGSPSFFVDFDWSSRASSGVKVGAKVYVEPPGGALPQVIGKEVRELCVIAENHDSLPPTTWAVKFVTQAKRVKGLLGA